jgi:hypothetical protein
MRTYTRVALLRASDRSSDLVCGGRKDMTAKVCLIKAVYGHAIGDLRPRRIARRP